MSLLSPVRHYQSTFIAVAIAAVVCLALCCQSLRPDQQSAVVDIATDTTQAIVHKQPIPWETILGLIGSILGGGLLVDNRRKDGLIKGLKINNGSSPQKTTA